MAFSTAILTPLPAAQAQAQMDRQRRSGKRLRSFNNLGPGLFPAQAGYLGQGLAALGVEKGDLLADPDSPGPEMVQGLLPENHLRLP